MNLEFVSQLNIVCENNINKSKKEKIQVHKRLVNGRTQVTDNTLSLLFSALLKKDTCSDSQSVPPQSPWTVPLDDIITQYNTRSSLISL